MAGGRIRGARGRVRDCVPLSDCVDCSSVCDCWICDWAKPVPIAYALIYLLFAFYVGRWNRGVLPVVTALAIIMIIFAAVAAPAWFAKPASCLRRRA